MKQKEAEGYMGWTNRNTWNVALWIGNEYAVYKLCLRMYETSKNAGDLADKLESFLGVIWGKATPDGVTMAAVNWAELADDWYESHDKVNGNV
jgi:hypothetical protein|tara:strand:- start:75 stop:353 length:279 start_codon:yes stop_codon:yes gene_type:complete